MTTLAMYLGMYLCLLALLVWVWHRLMEGSGREPNGDWPASQTLDGLHNGRPWPFDSPADESSRPDTHDAA